MRHSLRRAVGLGFIVWHTRHMFYHALIGVAWAFYLQNSWHMFGGTWFLIAIFGSIVPDAEHVLYFFTYGRQDTYTRNIRKFLANRQWRNMTVFIEKGHKKNTNLRFHNIYVIGILMIITSVGLLFDWNSWVVFLGAMMLHYMFDIFDDIVTLGYVNSNWKHWNL